MFYPKVVLCDVFLRQRRFYTLRVGKQIFQIDTRYQNLKVIGSGSYGVVCSADDVVGSMGSG